MPILTYALGLPRVTRRGHISGMAELPEIPLENGTPLELAARNPGKARALAEAAGGTFGTASRIAAALVMPFTDRASRAWLAQQDNPYLPEIQEMARLIPMPGVFSLNVCFEWGCTSGVWPSPDGPVLRRVMDWAFPALGENMVVLRRQGAAGEFLSFTWPGVSGIFQGLAPQRFAAAINQAPMRRHGAGFAGDWLLGRIALKRCCALPPAHLLRQVFETAPDYASAKKQLCEMPIALPAIFTLAGLRQGCVIERTEDDFALREMGETGVCTANHFRTRLDAMGRGWRARPIDSLGRAQAGDGLAQSDFAGDFAWFKPPIANAHSRLVFNANPGNGALALMGTDGAKPVTAILRLPA
jgi:hypothetical protein